MTHLLDGKYLRAEEAERSVRRSASVALEGRNLTVVASWTPDVFKGAAGASIVHFQLGVRQTAYPETC